MPELPLDSWSSWFMYTRAGGQNHSFIFCVRLKNRQTVAEYSSRGAPFLYEQFYHNALMYLHHEWWLFFSPPFYPIMLYLPLQFSTSNAYLTSFYLPLYPSTRREIIVRGQSYFSRLPKYWPSIPLSARRVCPAPATKAGGTHTLAGRRGGWGVNILEDERNRIVLLQWSLYASTYLKRSLRHKPASSFPYFSIPSPYLSASFKLSLPSLPPSLPPSFYLFFLKAPTIA